MGSGETVGAGETVGESVGADDAGDCRTRNRVVELRSTRGELVTPAGRRSAAAPGACPPSLNRSRAALRSGTSRAASREEGKLQLTRSGRRRRRSPTKRAATAGAGPAARARLERPPSSWTPSSFLFSLVASSAAVLRVGASLLVGRCLLREARCAAAMSTLASVARTTAGWSCCNCRASGGTGPSTTIRKPCCCSDTDGGDDTGGSAEESCGASTCAKTPEQSSAEDGRLSRMPVMTGGRCREGCRLLVLDAGRFAGPLAKKFMRLRGLNFGTTLSVVVDVLQQGARLRGYTGRESGSTKER